jgi:hypothetical protein
VYVAPYFASGDTSEHQQVQLAQMKGGGRTTQLYDRDETRDEKQVGTRRVVCDDSNLRDQKTIL